MGSGLSKKDPNSPESKFNTLTGLYPECSWDPKLVKKMVLERKLAPIYPGSENTSENIESLEKILEECPICFLYYPSLNRSGCCRQGICTECFLQVKSSLTASVSCPFCNRAKYSIYYSGPLSKEEKVRELEEQQKVTELQIKLQIEQERERAQSLPTNFDRAKEIQREEIKNRRESVSPLGISTTTTTPTSFDQFSQSAPSTNHLPFGRSPRSSSRSSSSVADEGAPFYDDWSALAEEAEIDEILLREAIQLSLQVGRNPSNPSTPSTSSSRNETTSPTSRSSVSGRASSSTTSRIGGAAGFVG